MIPDRGQTCLCGVASYQRSSPPWTTSHAAITSKDTTMTVMVPPF